MTSDDRAWKGWVPGIVQELYQGWTAATAAGDELSVIVEPLGRAIRDERCRKVWQWLAALEDRELSDLCIEIVRVECSADTLLNKDRVKEGLAALRNAENALGPIQGAAGLAAHLESDLAELEKTVPRQTKHWKATLLIRTLDDSLPRRPHVRSDGYYSRLAELVEVLTDDVLDSNEVRKIIERSNEKAESGESEDATKMVTVDAREE